MNGRRQSCGSPRPARRRASGLIVVLWIVGVLSMFVISFAFDAHIEARIVSYYRKRTKASQLAVSGIEIARMLMDASDAMGKNHQRTPEDGENRWYDTTKRLADGQAVEGLVENLGDGTITLDIVPEPARRNVNLLKVDDWERILELSGVPEDLWPKLIDPIGDWLDPDNDPRLDGAESEDYYETLEKPYRAKNGPLDTVEELLLVKGFTRTILYGGVLASDAQDENPPRLTGLADLLTTYGDGRVNVNAASARVLMTLPEVDEVVAGAIVEEREGRPGEESTAEDRSFSSVEDFMGRIPGLPAGLRGYVTTDSQIYRVTSVGTVHGVRRQVWCIVRHAGRRLTILRWREEEEG